MACSYIICYSVHPCEYIFLGVVTVVLPQINVCVIETIVIKVLKFLKFSVLLL